MDKNVRPQDDLFRFVNGTWLANTPFPAEYASAGIGIMLFEKAQSDVQAILLEAAAAGDKATPDMQRLGAMYTSFMDEKAVEARGIESLKPLFAEIAAIDGPKALATYFGRALGRGITVPIGAYVYPDARNSAYNVAYFDQDGLGMPNRDYYLKTEDTYVEFRKKYVEYLAKLLTLAGEPDGGGARGQDPRPRDEARNRPVDAGAEPRSGRDLQQEQPGVGGEARARVRLECLVRRKRPAVGDFIIRQPSYATALGKHVQRRRPLGLEGLPDRAHDRRLREVAAGRIR